MSVILFCTGFSVWPRTGSNPGDINQFGSHSGNLYGHPYIYLPPRILRDKTMDDYFPMMINKTNPSLSFREVFNTIAKEDSEFLDGTDSDFEVGKRQFNINQFASPIMKTN